MERFPIIKKIRELLNKYKFVILILMIGLVLLLLPDGNNKTDTVSQRSQESQKEDTSLSQQLEDVLATVEGAGRVRVMLTVSAGEEVIYQTNNDHSTNDNAVTDRSDTVVITDGERNESGLVKNTNAPVYRGAIVVCDGAQIPTVALSIVEAVSKITGLSTDKISVLKMQ